MCRDSNTAMISHMHTCTLIPDIYTSMYGLCKYMHAGTTVIPVCLALCTAIAVVYTSSFFDIWHNSYLINYKYIYMYTPVAFLMPCWCPLDALLMPCICIYAYGRMLLSPSDALLSFRWPSDALQTPFWCHQMPLWCPSTAFRCPLGILSDDTPYDAFPSDAPPKMSFPLMLSLQMPSLQMLFSVTLFPSDAFLLTIIHIIIILLLQPHPTFATLIN